MTPRRPLLACPLALLCFLTLALSVSAEEGYVSLFDGETLEGWDGDPKLWSVEGGAITGQTSDEDPIGYNSFLTWTGGEIDDFELKVEYKIESGNSGIQIRSFPRDGKPYAIGGYQADLEAGDKWSGTNYGEGYRGILAKRGEQTVIGEDGKPKVTGQVGDSAELQGHIKTGDWNEYHITARGNHLVYRINGHVMSEVTDEDSDTARRVGLLAFQLHKGPAMKVQFRNVRLKRLDPEGVKRIVFVAGKPSHAPGDHEHNAGCLLMARLLNEHYGDRVVASVVRNGWPADTSAFDHAEAVIFFADGGMRHPAYTKLNVIEKLREAGVGIGCIHYAVEMTPGASNDALIRAIGGAFEINYSVNPHWVAQFKSYPDHPVARGLQPFDLKDEWYFNMRFAEDMKGVTPILTAVPPDETMSRPDGRHSGNPEVRKRVAAKQPQHLHWVYERSDGGRGFGFTGAHHHNNFGDTNFRLSLLNAALWISGAEVPEAGAATPDLTQAELDANLDPKPPRKPRKPAKPAEAKK